MRILQVIPYFSPRMGGTVQVAYHLTRHLANHGHDLTILASNYKCGEVSLPESNFRKVLIPSILSRWGFYLTPALIAWARENVPEFDVIHLHETRTFQNAIVQYFAVRYGVPYVLSAHGTLPVIVQRKLAKKVYDLIFGRRLLASASRLIAVSPVEVEQYRRAGIEEERIRILYNGLDLEEFSRLPSPGAFRTRMGIADHARVVLFLGRLHKIKGIDHLIEAFARLQNEEERSVLLIAGPDDGELENLQTLARIRGLEDRVQFLGPLYGKDKLTAYVDADVLALPAVYEIFGLVAFEALMCGTPVVVTDDCGSGQIVAEAHAGYTVPYGDVDALEEALRRAFTNREEAMRKVKAGQAYIRERLDWNAIVRSLEGVYRELRPNRISPAASPIGTAGPSE